MESGKGGPRPERSQPAAVASAGETVWIMGESALEPGPVPGAPAAGGPVHAVTVVTLLEKLSSMLEGLQERVGGLASRQGGLAGSVLRIQRCLGELSSSHDRTSNRLEQLLTKAERVGSHADVAQERAVFRAAQGSSVSCSSRSDPPLSPSKSGNFLRPRGAIYSSFPTTPTFPTTPPRAAPLSHHPGFSHYTPRPARPIKARAGHVHTICSKSQPCSPGKITVLEEGSTPGDSTLSLVLTLEANNQRPINFTSACSFQHSPSLLLPLPNRVWESQGVFRGCN